MSFLMRPLRPTFEAALRDVEATRPELRLAAAARLVDLPTSGDPRAARSAALDGLHRLTQDKDAEVRRLALTGIARLADATSSEVAIRGIADDDPRVREAAVIAIGEIGGEKCLRALRQAIASDLPEVRFQALAAFGKVAGEDARAALSVALGDPDPLVRGSAIEALGELGPSHDACTRIARLLDGQPREVVAEAALALGKLGDRRAIPVLIELIGGDRGFEAMALLGDLDAKEGTEPLRQLADAFLRPQLVKAAAATALIRLGDPHGGRVLSGILRGWRSDARTFCVEVIGELGLHEHTDAIVAMVDRPRGADPRAVVHTLHALARTDPRARDALDALATRPTVAGGLARALIENSHPGADDDTPDR